MRYAPVVVVGVMLLLMACRSNPLSPSGPPGIGGAAFNRVVIVVEENESAEQVFDNPQMPYLNSLAAGYARATEYYADTHPSIGNYCMLVVGNVVTNDDTYSGVISDDNIVRRLVAAGLTWKSYAEDLPAVGYLGGDTGLYARKHNVFALLSDVVNAPEQQKNLVPFTQFAADLAGNRLPNYSFVVPNLCNNGHNCPVSTADSWLQRNIGPLVGSSAFQRDGLLIITYDEGEFSDMRHGGGKVPWIAVSARSRRGYRSTTFYQHESTLRLVVESLGLLIPPNQAAAAPGMNEFFGS